MFSALTYLVAEVVLFAAFIEVGVRFTAFKSGNVRERYAPFWLYMLAALAGGIVSLIPTIGWALGWLAVVFVLVRFTGADLLEVLLIVLVSRVAVFFAAPVILLLAS